MLEPIRLLPIRLADVQIIFGARAGVIAAGGQNGILPVENSAKTATMKLKAAKIAAATLHRSWAPLQ
jgi:hypothetical protein